MSQRGLMAACTGNVAANYFSCSQYNQENEFKHLKHD